MMVIGLNDSSSYTYLPDPKDDLSNKVQFIKSNEEELAEWLSIHKGQQGCDLDYLQEIDHAASLGLLDTYTNQVVTNSSRDIYTEELLDQKDRCKCSII